VANELCAEGREDQNGSQRDFAQVIVSASHLIGLPSNRPAFTLRLQPIWPIFFQITSVSGSFQRIQSFSSPSLRGLHLPERLLFLVYAAVRAAQFDLQDFLCTQRERYKGASLLGVLIWAEEARERLFFL
jgi:hypothetical protein